MFHFSTKTMNNIKIEIKGRVLDGEFKDWNIFIQDLNKSDGAYLILLTSPDGTKGYDDWVENLQALQGYFQEAQLNIKWLDDQSD